MNSPIDTVKVSSVGRSALIKAKKDLGLSQWNELLRNAFCLSISDTSPPTKLSRFDVGIDPIDWATFAGEYEKPFLSLLYHRAQSDGIDTKSKTEMNDYFRLHIERGVASLRSFKSISELCGTLSQSNNPPFEESD